MAIRRCCLPLAVVAACVETPTTPPPPYAAMTLTTIYAGAGVACGLGADTLTYCWGAPGQVGRLVDSGCAATPACRGVPAPLDPALRFVKFTLARGGAGQSCGITAAGQSYCWGGLGGFDYTFWSYLTPVPFPSTGTFQVMSSGVHHTCALDLQSQAWCWGANYEMELGTGFSFDSIEATDVPQAVAGGGTFNGLSAGNLHTCALNEAGQAFCWGDAASGQLGVGPVTADADACVFLIYCLGTPTPVRGNLAFSALSAGGAHTCAITAGVLYCWGADDVGQLGTAGTDTCPSDAVVTTSGFPCALAPVPVAFPFPSGAQTIVSVTSGRTHSCALTEAGRVYCWGSNDRGQLGIGRHGGSVARPAPVVGGPAVVRTIAAGWDFTCAIGSDDDAWCWGSNEAGQLGDGTLEDRDTPVPVRRPPP
jgi:alpha-tubulin suppressor-like RCC1 family protein